MTLKSYNVETLMSAPSRQYFFTQAFFYFLQKTTSVFPFTSEGYFAFSTFQFSVATLPAALIPFHKRYRFLNAVLLNSIIRLQSFCSSS